MYQKRLQQLVQSGHSAAYIESTLWASFSRNHSLRSISSDVEKAMSECGKN